MSCVNLFRITIEYRCVQVRSLKAIPAPSFTLEYLLALPFQSDAMMAKQEMPLPAAHSARYIVSKQYKLVTKNWRNDNAFGNLDCNTREVAASLCNGHCKPLMSLSALLFPTNLAILGHTPVEKKVAADSKKLRISTHLLGRCSSVNGAVSER